MVFLDQQVQRFSDYCRFVEIRAKRPFPVKPQ
jgi:hypothetical protein